MVSMSTLRAPIVPGKPTPIREVPASIERPEYVWKDEVQEAMGEPFVQPPEVIEAMRKTSRIAANSLKVAGEAVRPGITTDELDRIVHEYTCDHGAYPSDLGYRGFTKSTCISLNEIVCHGIPDSTVIEDGDIVNIDVTAFKYGVHGDCNATFLAGNVSEEHRLLVERTKEAMMRGIRAAKPGREINVIGRVIESYAKRFGYNVVTDFTGHGIGTTFHNGLIVLHYDSMQYRDLLVPGMTLTVEPMINIGSLDYDIWDDGWTVQNRDRRFSAQFEHTIVINEDGPEILTLPDADV
ncbi:type I methionyl aminopeptidase [Corynebacterium pacaense]|uniref:type I methionyl aminopeptidase n=1 Tax=Corynebacterium pacaense TaxID=1816684 RepID=UPI0009B978B6